MRQVGVKAAYDRKAVLRSLLGQRLYLLCDYLRIAMQKLPIYLLCSFLFLVSCSRKEEGPEEINTRSEEWYPGGITTVFASGVDAYSQPLNYISTTHLARHNAGRSIFFQEFSEYGAAEFGGLGPLFSQASCGGCHPGNGRSQPPMSEIDHASGLLMRISIAGSGPHGGPLAVPGFGTQLQTRALDGIAAEGLYLFSYNDFSVNYEDGASVILHDPSHSIIDAYTTLPPNVLYSMRNASQVYGSGLLEAVNESEILSYADESDDNSDDISGKPNFVWNEKTGLVELGRFGWKSSHPTVDQQAAGAFNEDMGITSSGFFPVENGYGQNNCTTGFGPGPDAEADVIEAVSFYIRTLAVPAPRDLDAPIVQQGRQIFYDLNCVGCHRPALHTGSAVVSELSGQTIYPYTDMLLHDMGEVLADGRPDFGASTNEWRTPPLWGIGLAKVVNPNARFLHDGRAETIEEAILWHGGEAHWIIEYYKALPFNEREALLAFLNAL